MAVWLPSSQEEGNKSWDDKMKRCCRCKLEKEENEFHKNSSKKDGLGDYCKYCISGKDIVISKKRSEPVLDGLKRCKKCGEWKPLQDFYTDLRGIGGRRPECKSCVKPSSWRRTLPLSKRQKVAKNKRNMERTNSNPKLKLKKCISDLLRITLRNHGKKKIKSTFLYTGIKYSEYIEHFKSDPLWNDYTNKSYLIHVDHIIPQSLFNYTFPEEIAKCWNPRNLRFLSAGENIIKSNKFLPELVIQYGIEDLLPKGLNMS